MGMSNLRRKRARVLVGLVIFAAAAALIYWFGPRSVSPDAAQVTGPSATLPLTATPAPLPTPTPVFGPPLPSPAAARRPRPTPLGGGTVVVLRPAREAVGWASSLDGRSHFGVPDIHAGVLHGNTYYGALQFDLTSVAPNAILTSATLELTGLNAEHLSAGGDWQVQLLAPAINARWSDLTFEMLRKAAVEATIPLAPTARDLGEGKTTTFEFDSDQLVRLQAQLNSGQVSFRLEEATGSGALFTWDTGYRLTEESEAKPALVITLAGVNVSPYVIITSAPTPENILTAAAVAATATELARAIGTPTPLPPNWVTPVIVSPQPSPANAATAVFLDAVATAQSLLYGTPTPAPANLWTVTPAPPRPDAAQAAPTTGAPLPGRVPSSTPTPVMLPLAAVPRASIPTSTPTSPLPAVLKGKILFLSDYAGSTQAYAINPDGSGGWQLTDAWPYEQAAAQESLALGGRLRVFVKTDPASAANKTDIFYADALYNATAQMSFFMGGISWAPAWSPAGDAVAFVSNDTGNDEIWVVHKDQWPAVQLTNNQWEWDHHPSWSPDGQTIVFSSNRSGVQQLWLMEADGGAVRPLTDGAYNAWDPVWVK